MKRKQFRVRFFAGKVLKPGRKFCYRCNKVTKWRVRNWQNNMQCKRCATVQTINGF